MSEQRKRILELVEKGTISAQEALALLEALDKEKATEEEKEKDIFNELVADVHEEKKNEEKSEKTSSHQKQKDKLMDFMQSALNKIKNLDFDFQINHSVEISHVFQQSDVLLKEVSVDVANGKVELHPWDQNEVRIECKAKVYRTEDEEAARRNFLANTTFSIENGALRYGTELKWMKVDTKIYIPQQQYEKMYVRIFNGGIKANKLETETLKLKTANGRIDVNGLKSKKAEIDTSNGAIKLLEVVSEKVEVESINGKILVEGDINYSDLQSLNGNVVFTLTGEKADTIHTKAVTGNIDLYVPEHMTIEGEAKSNLGSFKMAMKGIEVIEEKNEVVQKHIRFSKQGDLVDKLHIFADTKTGSVLIKKYEPTNDTNDEA
jgi:DUF4097 and DUF4098 domain-containing protein YvlB